MLDEKAIQALTQATATEQANAALTKALFDNDGLGFAPAAVALPQNFSVVDVETYLPYRRHARGTMTTSHVVDFATYVGTHAEPGCTVFVDDAIRAVAVLNLGDPTAAGHADNLAVLAPVQTAAYKALLNVAGKQLSQRDAAEFLEDWTDVIKCMDTGEIATSKAVSAIRRLTIEAARKATSEVKQLAESRSAFEQVEAKSEDPIPEFIYFRCKPYSDLNEREFILRVGVATTEPPTIKLQLRQHEQHVEEMAKELADVVSKAAAEKAPEVGVVLGKYQRS